MRPRHPGQGRDLGHRMHRARLGHIGDRHRSSLHPMHASTLGLDDRRLERRRVHPPMRAMHQRQLCAMHVKLRRAAFILGDMSVLVAKHRTPRRRQKRQRQRIGHGARGHQIDRRFRRLKNLADLVARPVHEGIGAIAARIARIGRRHRRHHLRRGPARIVRCEPHSQLLLKHVIVPVVFRHGRLGHRLVAHGIAGFMRGKRIARDQRVPFGQRLAIV